MRITIHQPEFMPWLGFFHKIDMADLYVVLDNVQYRRRYFQNRNKIRTPDGWQWINVPVEKDNLYSLLIRDVIVNNSIPWAKKIINSIQHQYGRSEYFKKLWPPLKKIFEKRHLKLVDINMEIIQYFFEKLGINPEIVNASTLNVNGKKNEIIFNICKKMGAEEYISGISGRDYLDLEMFKNNNIKVIFQEFHHPIYKQLYEPFIPCMSTIDLLLNYGNSSHKILRGEGVDTIEEIFL